MRMREGVACRFGRQIDQVRFLCEFMDSEYDAAMSPFSRSQALSKAPSPLAERNDCLNDGHHRFLEGWA